MPGTDFFLITASLEPLFEIIFRPPFFAAIFIFFTFLYLAHKLKTISNLKAENNKLINSLQKLEEQAKLILKNDMDIKLYQQEIEGPKKKISFLRKLLAATSHLLDKDSLFEKINSAFIEELGFKKSLILDFNNFEEITSSDFQSPEIEAIKNILLPKKAFLKEKSILSPEDQICKIISSKLGLKNVLIALIKTQNKAHAVFAVAGLIDSELIKRYVKESFLIICMYLAKCLDSIELFEQVYKTKEELENKIKIRTKELALSLQKVETISKTKSDFISSVSHELRTPLTSVKGFSSLLADEKFGTLPDEAKKRLIKVVENVDKLMDIVNTLLDISRIESGKREINIAPYDLVLLIKNVAEFLEPQSRSKNIKILLNTPENLFVYMDKDLIERVLINLINNAIKFTPTEGKITISCQEDREKAITSVADTGYGIAVQDLEKIFREFYRVAEVEQKSIKGSGLGLSLVKKIIDSHGQKIWVESELRKGSCFFFTLQRKKNG